MTTFPDSFIFGVATAAYQIEGAADEDGRGRSIWDTFCRVPDKVHHGDTGDRACDHYHRVETDLDLLVELGVNAYRFSIAWPRVLPDGSGTVNRKGIDFYKRVVDGLHERNILPMATLYHWDLPQALGDKGGWTNRETAFRFADYVAVVAEELREEVAMWVTVNEPWCSSFVGYLEGRHAPGETDLEHSLLAAHHLLLGHGLAVQALRAANVSGDVGLVLNLSDTASATNRRDDIAATKRIDGNENRWFLDPVFKGSYPADMLSWYSGRADVRQLREEDRSVIASPIDFLGVNYYEQHIVETNDADNVHGARKLAPRPPMTDANVPIRPVGLANILRRVQAEYTNLPIYITENGAAFNDYITPEGLVQDVERVDYLQKHFAAVHECISSGLDVRGYFVWSFLDNFEWAEGYSRRFGIVFVDFGSQQRIFKASARWLQQLIAAQKMP